MSEAPRTVGEVIDEIPVGRFQRRMLLLTGAAWATAAMEIIIISFTIPTFTEVWSLSSVQAGLLGSATPLGMIFGNVVGGWYADRFGRKHALTASVAFSSVATGMTALAVGVYSAFLLRLLTGLGAGGIVAIGASFLTEHVPSARRGRYLAYLEWFFAFGNLLTVALAWVILSAVDTGGLLTGVASWRLLYAVAATSAVLAVVIHYGVAESPYYLVTHGRTARASERLHAIATENGVDLSLSSVTLATREGVSAGFSRLFDPDVRATTLLASVFWIGQNLGYYGVFIWLPDTVQAAGYVGGLYRYLFVVMVFQLLGVGAASLVVDRIGRKRTLAVAFTMAGLSTAVFTVAIPGVDLGLGIGGRGPFLVGLFATGFFIFAVFGAIFAYTTELFPTEVRGTGLGFTGGVGKVAAVGGPVLVGALVPFGYLAALAPFALALVLSGVLVGVFGRETMGESLT
jgi:putative MFS transporter